MATPKIEYNGKAFEYNVKEALGLVQEINDHPPQEDDTLRLVDTGVVALQALYLAVVQTLLETGRLGDGMVVVWRISRALALYSMHLARQPAPDPKQAAQNGQEVIAEVLGRMAFGEMPEGPIV